MEKLEVVDYKTVPGIGSNHIDPGELARESQIDINADIDPPQPAISYNGISIGTLGNFSTITGKAKSRKSFLATLLAGATMAGEYCNLTSALSFRNLLYFDTEQSKYYVQKVAKRIVSISRNDEFLKVYHLRKYRPSERLQIIEYVISNTPGPGLIVIDGIRDLVNSINDESEATAIATKLLNWTETFNVHIITILHQNKADNNARGHVGTELLNKSETVLSVTRDDENPEISLVRFDYCRGIDPEPFAFTVTDTGLPILTDYNFTKVSEKYLDKVTRLCTEIFGGQRSFSYGEAIQRLIDTTKTAEVTAKKYFKAMRDNELITQGDDKNWRLKR